MAQVDQLACRLCDASEAEVRALVGELSSFGIDAFRALVQLSDYPDPRTSARVLCAAIDVSRQLSAESPQMSSLLEQNWSSIQTGVESIWRSDLGHELASRLRVSAPDASAAARLAMRRLAGFMASGRDVPLATVVESMAAMAFLNVLSPSAALSVTGLREVDVGDGDYVQSSRNPSRPDTHLRDEAEARLASLGVAAAVVARCAGTVARDKSLGSLKRVVSRSASLEPEPNVDAFWAQARAAGEACPLSESGVLEAVAEEWPRTKAALWGWRSDISDTGPESASVGALHRVYRLRGMPKRGDRIWDMAMCDEHLYWLPLESRPSHDPWSRIAQLEVFCSQDGHLCFNPTIPRLQLISSARTMLREAFRTDAFEDRILLHCGTWVLAHAPGREALVRLEPLGGGDEGSGLRAMTVLEGDDIFAALDPVMLGLF